MEHGLVCLRDPVLPVRATLLAGVVLAALAGCTASPDAPTQRPVVPSESTEPPGPPPGTEVPEGMVYVPGGTTTVGSRTGLRHERPVFTAVVAPFFLDRAPVTVAEFRAFTAATDFQTQAERFGNAGVFGGPEAGWVLVDGACWHHPLGPDGPAARADHPVTQVSWYDAVAYADWVRKRLPTEVEREHAARNGRNDEARYSWGERVDEDGRYRANVWQGGFPHRNSGADGFLLTSPVGAFGESPLGLVDMGGNVWEWTADWFRPYDERDVPFTSDAASERAHRGGSFLCDGAVCHGYRVSARMGTTPETALFHTGFRLARDLDVGSLRPSRGS